MLKHTLEFLVSRPLRAIFMVLLFIILCGLGLKKAGCDNNYKSYFNNDNLQMQAFNRLEQKIAIALVADFIFLPPLLLWVAGKAQNAGERAGNTLASIG